MTGGPDFPFTRAVATDEDEELRGRIIQVLFTAPGERIALPEFGCGLFGLVFDPADAVLASAVEFTVGQALTRWLGDEIVVGAVDVSPADEGGRQLIVQVDYLRRKDLARRALRVSFA
ncbi:GPW/gp25 family protein [Paractinoplanes durhamensis]|uniref:IraD/Gp25-like domain-containing protein n=1 Tax=Paractinoplanes durhamensis TaxID=113563 RepID=A0ABQ3Z768_9ACTN|nr:GPW/gp25 family protein [Actinoplanes durhamensis]GIE05665.1 hypothetical protein Adu01nite_70150 [Actinoplanes durhamensis]